MGGFRGISSTVTSTHIVRDLTGYLRARKTAVDHRDGHIPRIEEYGADVELATVAHREPQAIVEFLIGHREAQTLDISPQQHLHRHRNTGGEFGGDHNGLAFGRIDQGFAFPVRVLLCGLGRKLTR